MHTCSGRAGDALAVHVGDAGRRSVSDGGPLLLVDDGLRSGEAAVVEGFAAGGVVPGAGIR